MSDNEKHEIEIPLLRAGVPNRNGVAYSEDALKKACETFNSRNLSPEQKKAILTQEPLQLGIRTNATMEADGVTIKSIGPIITFNLVE